MLPKNGKFLLAFSDLRRCLRVDDAVPTRLELNEQAFQPIERFPTLRTNDGDVDGRKLSTQGQLPCNLWGLPTHQQASSNQQQMNDQTPVDNVRREPRMPSL
jgi:hypothetical protein